MPRRPKYLRQSPEDDAQQPNSESGTTNSEIVVPFSICRRPLAVLVVSQARTRT
jgi:hypothetical protein